MQSVTYSQSVTFCPLGCIHLQIAFSCCRPMHIAPLFSRLLPRLWRRWLLAAILLALLVVVGARVWQAYQQRVATYRHQVETALRAVSQLQAANIAD